MAGLDLDGLDDGAGELASVSFRVQLQGEGNKIKDKLTIQ